MSASRGLVLHDTSMRLQGSFSHRMRQRRMAWFLEAMAPAPGTRIVDLGGTAGFWVDCPVPLDITVVNLPGELEPVPASQHRFDVIAGDACALPDLADGAFEIAFSNSVIEHVGPFARRAALAAEVRRLAPRYWVQTPSAAFPIEAHNHMPFWWFYPEPVRNRFLRRWRRTLPARTAMIEGTTVVSRAEMRDLFPEATLRVERLALLPKSYIAYRA